MQYPKTYAPDVTIAISTMMIWHYTVLLIADPTHKFRQQALKYHQSIVNSRQVPTLEPGTYKTINA